MKSIPSLYKRRESQRNPLTDEEREELAKYLSDPKFKGERKVPKPFRDKLVKQKEKLTMAK